MKILTRTVLVTILSLSMLNCQPEELRKGLVHFDQAFLPVLFYTYEGNLLRAKSAVFFLDFRWQRLQNQYANQLPAEADWQETFRRIDGWLGDAYYAIDANRPRVALNQLEHVKYELISLRKRYGIDYYPDHLFDFQVTLDILIETTDDELLCFLQWEELEALAARTNQKWQNVLAEPFNAAVYELNPEQAQMLRYRQAEVTRTLQHFNEMMACADREELALAAAAVEPALMQVIRLFGNMEASKTFYAVR